MSGDRGKFRNRVVEIWSNPEDFLVLSSWIFRIYLNLNLTSGKVYMTGWVDEISRRIYLELVAKIFEKTLACPSEEEIILSTVIKWRKIV